MKFKSRIRGPRLGTKLMVLGLALLVVPWLSYSQLVEMERLLIQGQQNAQLLTAEGISTLFNGRDDLFSDLPVSIDQYESLYAHPLQGSVRIDGDYTDWGEGIEAKFEHFGPADPGDADGSFDLALGERGGQLYVFMRVRDENRVYRNPGFLRLDTADHVRVSFIRDNGEDGRISVTFPKAGVATAYRMDPDWRFAETGAPENAVQGALAETDDGFAIEFRMPLSIMGSRRDFALTFVDVDDPQTQEIRAITQTLPKAGKESFNLVVFRSAELLSIIQGLGYAGARILVVDAQNRVRAETGSFDTESLPVPGEPWTFDIRDWFRKIRPLLHRIVIGEVWDEPSLSSSEDVAAAAITAALQGKPDAVRRRVSNSAQIIMALHPIVSKEKILGAVVVEQNINEILSFQRAALEQIVLVSILSLLVVFVVLITFSGRLAWRIGNLRREATAAIDQYGRLKTNTIKSEVNAGDEIGDLSRSIDNILSRLHQHNTFLENMPRTLRHEINNPLNTLSTSLQNLEQESDEVRDSKYLESAKRAILRIGSIVQNLADAANLDESLESEELEVLDIQELLKSYVNNCRITHPRQEFVFRGVEGPVLAKVADYRIEQLLDKIVDNAIDFHRTNSPIKIQLDRYREHLQITVANRGPTLPASEVSLFESMVSHRGQHNRLHFGLGLYVVRVIAEYHGGTVRALNLADGSGVAIMVQLPLAQGQATSRAVEEPARVAIPG